MIRDDNARTPPPSRKILEVNFQFNRIPGSTNRETGPKSGGLVPPFWMDTSTMEVDPRENAYELLKSDGGPNEGLMRSGLMWISGDPLTGTEYRESDGGI